MSTRGWMAALGALVLLGSISVVVTISCQPSPPEPHGELGAVELSPPTRLCVGGLVSDCRPVGAIRETMRRDDLALVQAASAPGGLQGAAVLTASTPGGLIFDAKWRSVESASRYNDPLSELAADRLQLLLLAPEDSVVPPAAAHCFAHDLYVRRLGHDRRPVPGTSCVLGFLSLWLVDAVGMNEARRRGLVPGEPGSGDPQLYDSARFASDEPYRRNIAHLNLMAFVMAHGDAHAGQFVVYPEPPHVWLVDNSVAFGLDHRSSMDSRQDLARLVVPSIPRDTAERLKSLTFAQVQTLRVLAELEIRGGRLVARAHGEPFGGPDQRLRRLRERVQIGLTTEQTEGVWRRVEQLRRYLEGGALGVF